MWRARFGTLAAALLALLIAATLETRGQEPTTPPAALDIQVQPGAFGQAGPRDIEAVLQSAGDALWRRCSGVDLDGIAVYRTADHPQIALKKTRAGRIAIGLSAHDAFWAQYSFEFAHEFCHALANFTDGQKPAPAPPRRANLWLEESLCETASLVTLRAMSRSWQTAPPYPVWHKYAPWLKAYADARLARRENRLPASETFPAWFRENEPTLRQNPLLRDRNTIVATQLMPLFEAEPRGWKAVCYLNRGTANPEESLAQHLTEWQAQCPAELRPFVGKLAEVFGVALAIR